MLWEGLLECFRISADLVPEMLNRTRTTSNFNQESPRQTKPKKGQFMNFSQGHSGTKVQRESCLFSQGETPEFTKMGEVHELFDLPLSLVWFAGATPDSISTQLAKRQDFASCCSPYSDWEAPGLYWKAAKEVAIQRLMGEVKERSQIRSFSLIFADYC